MEMRSENNEKRRRKPIQKTPVLVRSVKPGQVSQVWERESTSTTGMWKLNMPAA